MPPKKKKKAWRFSADLFALFFRWPACCRSYFLSRSGDSRRGLLLKAIFQTLPQFYLLTYHRPRDTAASLPSPFLSSSALQHR